MKGHEGTMDTMKPSILDLVKAAIQRVFTRHPLSDGHAESETPSTTTAAPTAPVIIDPPASSGAGDAACEPGKLWLTQT